MNHFLNEILNYIQLNKIRLLFVNIKGVGHLSFQHTIDYLIACFIVALAHPDESPPPSQINHS